ncbi:MAG: polysaccharide export protein [Acaryochloris sp. CRU_2_0]|nr:polysaccharide export protein [Acaryochloris sp. CRU_2_0]
MLKYLYLSLYSFLLSCVWVLPGWGLPLSPGDRLKISIPEGEEFNGIYEVNVDGTLGIPYLEPLPVVGLELPEVQQQVTQSLIQGGFFQPSFLRVSVNLVQWAPIEVFVSGETYLPGRVLINEQSDAEKTQPLVPVTGQYASQRMLTSAIRNAGGIKPNANIQAIQLIRNGQTRLFDLSGIFTGIPVEDVPLVAGDRIVVPDAGEINPSLVRPSAITPVGVKIFLSNLTVPATGNAISGIGRDATSFPYGSRFSHGVTAANCAGGTKTTNAGRRALLVRTDQLTGKTQYLERKVDDILKKSINDAENPFLMANDSIACYDSPTIQARDIVDTIVKFLSPFSLIKELWP